MKELDEREMDILRWVRIGKRAMNEIEKLLYTEDHKAPEPADRNNNPFLREQREGYIHDDE